MPIQCPNCGSRFLRDSKPRDAAEKRLAWRFMSPLRCLDCKTRFVGKTFSLGDMRYAHCPQCDRMDLNQWTGKNYLPPFFTAFLIGVGANRWRCEYCRVNFASFRKRKEIFTFKRWQNLKSHNAVAQGRARLAEMEARADEARVMADTLELAAIRAEAEELARAEAEAIATDEAQAIARAMAATFKPKASKPPAVPVVQNAQDSRHDLQE
jgi:DNA-directed RNA polymerase subunit RPC12/RpoP